MKKIFPILLAGGAGTRLWPISRKSYPKQFSNLIGEKTLFQQTALRLLSSNLVNFLPHITLTNSNYRFIVKEQFQSIGIEPDYILIEPEAKNTASSILAASFFCQSKDPDAILLVVPTDHIMPDLHDFHEAVSIGLSHVDKGKVVTFGITPEQPNIGYGYLEIAKDYLDETSAYNVLRFVEKPTLENARKMIKNKNFLWNSGIYLFKASEMVKLFTNLATEFISYAYESVNNANEDLGFLRLAPNPWSKLKNISIDYAIMEKTTNLVAIPYNSKWSDLGGWDAVWSETQKDSMGNATSARAHTIDCSNTLIRSESSNQQIIGIGLKNIVAISTQDAVLVTHKDKAQDVKEAVALLKKNDVPQAEIFPKDHRPWGWFENLFIGKEFKVKRIHVNPGASLSLQSHKQRSEHWVVVEGKAKVTINNKIKNISKNQSVYVPLGVIHRIENTTKNPLVLIEVQIGSYLGEDDIIRYEDIYARD